MSQSGLWWNDGKESFDDWIINQWPKNDGKGFGTNRVSIEYTMIIELNGMECVDPKLELLIDLDKSSENGRNIYEWNQINQTILEIDFDWTFPNESGRLTFCRFGISKYDQYSIFRNTFQRHWTRINETTSFRIDGC